jgi:hypothetical protein
MMVQILDPVQSIIVPVAVLPVNPSSVQLSIIGIAITPVFSIPVEYSPVELFTAIVGGVST